MTFSESLGSKSTGGFVSDLPDPVPASMRMFLLEGVNAGGAVSDAGEIVAFHNNSDRSGIGRDILKFLVANGGSWLSHFDGFLTGYYMDAGFSPVGVYDWDDSLAPEVWNYESIDFTKSVYSYVYPSFTERPEWLFEKLKRYECGKPDIVIQAAA